MDLQQYYALFSKIEFQTPLSDALRATVAQCAENATLRRSVYRLPGSKNDRWSVKYYIARKQFVFGIFQYSDLATALRLADMIILKFKPYRQRDRNRPLHESDFNLTEAQARHDLESEHEVNSLLVQFFSDLPESDLQPVLRTNRTGSAAKIVTLMHEMKAALAAIDKRLDAIERSIDRRSLIPADYVPGAARPTLVYPPNVTPIPPSPQPYFGDPPTTPIGDQPSTPIFSVNISCATDGDGGNVSQ